MSDYKSRAEEADIQNVDELSEEIYFVLQWKTEGDAELRVSSINPGQGIEAYMRLYLWFAGTTGLALSEVMRLCMHPISPKFDYEIADALEKWLEQERRLRAHGQAYTLNAALKITALQTLMRCKREQFDSMEREARGETGGIISEATYDSLCMKVREYA